MYIFTTELLFQFVLLLVYQKIHERLMNKNSKNVLVFFKNHDNFIKHSLQLKTIIGLQRGTKCENKHIMCINYSNEHSQLISDEMF